MFDRLNFEQTGFVNEPVVVSKRGFDDMLEYSRSLPTGKTIGKVWRRRVEFTKPYEKWWVVTYVAIPCKESVGIRWQPLHVAEGVVLGAILAAFGL